MPSGYRDDEEVSAREICAFLKISRSKFFALAKAGTIPTHLTIIGRRVMWKSDLWATREQAAQRIKKHD
jgi:predicted DNA-binding transcriptional regulator AlpA